MNFAIRSATALSLVLTLAACGGGDDGADDTVAVSPAASASATAAPASDPASATPTPGASMSPTPTPSASASATSSPSPTPSPSASASRGATPVAAATKPAEFAVCSACHSTDPGKNGIGPSLAGVYGKKAAHLASYDYSEAMEKSGLTWNDAGLNRFLTDPQGVVPGTKMAYPGLKDAARRRAMIDYLKTL